MTRPNPRIACIGECMIEMVLPDASGSGSRVGFAGDSFNTAVYMKRAAPALSVSYVTALGTDAASDRMIAAFSAEGLETDLIERRPDRLPGAYAIATDDRGERSFLYWRDASAARTLFQPPARVTPHSLAGFGLIYLSGITVAILAPEARKALRSFLADYRAQGGRVAFDSNFRSALWPDAETARGEIAAFWALCDIGLPSLDDEQALFGDPDAEAVRARLRAAGVRCGALKRGPAGPLPIDPDLAPQSFPAAPRIVDTTAAGDSFNGAYLAALMQGAPAAACLDAGHATACRVIGQPGAILPRREAQ